MFTRPKPCLRQRLEELCQHSLLKFSKFPTACDWQQASFILFSWVGETEVQKITDSLSESETPPENKPQASWSLLFLDSNCSNKLFMLVEIPIKKQRLVLQYQSPWFWQPGGWPAEAQLVLHSTGSNTICANLSSLGWVWFSKEWANPTAHLPAYGHMDSANNGPPGPTGDHVHTRHLPVPQVLVLVSRLQCLGTHLFIDF